MKFYRYCLDAYLLYRNLRSTTNPKANSGWDSRKRGMRFPRTVFWYNLAIRLGCKCTIFFRVYFLYYMDHFDFNSMLPFVVRRIFAPVNSVTPVNRYQRFRYLANPEQMSCRHLSRLMQCRNAIVGSYTPRLVSAISLRLSSVM